jgi:hypothetical protein
LHVYYAQFVIIEIEAIWQTDALETGSNTRSKGRGFSPAVKTLEALGLLAPEGAGASAIMTESELP